MKKTLTTLCILVLTVGVLGTSSADACGDAKKVAANATSCSTKAACSTDKAAYINTMAETAYNNSLTEKHCSATAANAAFAAVKEETGCTQTAAAAYQHAVAKAAYDQSFTATGCTQTAEKAYDVASLAAASDVEKMAKSSVDGDDS